MEIMNDKKMDFIRKFYATMAATNNNNNRNMNGDILDPTGNY